MSAINLLRYGMYRARVPLSNYGGIKLLQRNRFPHHQSLRNYNRPWSRPPSYKGQQSSMISSPFQSINRFFNQMPTTIRNLIYLNSAIFVLFQIAPQFAFNNFTLKKRDLSNGRLYTPLTCIFGHFSFIHFAFNMIMLYFYGPMILSYLSINRFYQLYLASGILGSLSALSLMSANGACLGASGSIFGIMSFVTMKAPHSTLLLYGILPMKLWHCMALIVIVESYMLNKKIRDQKYYGFSHGGKGICHEAHLTGIATGFLYYFAIANSML